MKIIQHITVAIIAAIIYPMCKRQYDRSMQKILSIARDNLKTEPAEKAAQNARLFALINQLQPPEKSSIAIAKELYNLSKPVKL